MRVKVRSLLRFTKKPGVIIDFASRFLEIHKFFRSKPDRFFGSLASEQKNSGKILFLNLFLDRSFVLLKLSTVSLDYKQIDDHFGVGERQRLRAPSIALIIEVLGAISRI